MNFVIWLIPHNTHVDTNPVRFHQNTLVQVCQCWAMIIAIVDRFALCTMYDQSCPNFHNIWSFDHFVTLLKWTVFYLHFHLSILLLTRSARDRGSFVSLDVFPASHAWRKLWGWQWFASRAQHSFDATCRWSLNFLGILHTSRVTYNPTIFMHKHELASTHAVL